MSAIERKKYRALEKAMYDLRMSGYTINDSAYCALVKERAQLENNRGVDIEHLVSELCDVVLNFDYEPLVHEGRTTNSEENQMIHNEIKQTLFNHGIHGCVYDAEYLKSKVQP